MIIDNDMQIYVLWIFVLTIIISTVREEEGEEDDNGSVELDNVSLLFCQQ